MARMAVSKTVDLGSSPGVPAILAKWRNWVDAGVSNTPARKGVKVRVLPWLLKDTDSNNFCFFRSGKVAQLDRAPAIMPEVTGSSPA